MIVYTTGYGAIGITKIEQIMDSLDLDLFDIRFSPNSVSAAWRKPSLVARFGERYHWIKDLGNVNYRGGEIKIHNLPAGIDRIINHPRGVVLVCACREYKDCHRLVIAEALRGKVEDVVELYSRGNWD